MRAEGRAFVTAAAVLWSLFLILSPCAKAAESVSPKTDKQAEEKAAGDGVVIARPAVRPVVLTGFTRPRRTMTLVSEEAGRCLEVLADVGDTIGPDGVFARLDPVFIKLEIARIRADKIRLESEAQYNIKQLKRFKELVASETAAQQDLDDWKRRMEAAREQLNARKLEEQIQLEHLERYTIKAPAGWKVLKRYAEPGEWLSMGQAVAELGDFRSLLVPLAVTPFEYNWLRAEGNTTVKLYAPDEDRTVIGHVELVSPDFDPDTRKINTDLEIENGLTEMRGGIRMEVNMDMPDEHGGVLLPKNAVQVRYDEYFVTPVKDGRDQESVRVNLLGRDKAGNYRVASPAIRAGQKFRAAQ